MSDRTEWTAADVKAARREHAVATLGLADPVTLPWHLRDVTRDHLWRPRPVLPARSAPKHLASEPDDEEPSPAATIRRATTLQRVVVLGIAAGVLLIGFAAFRGLTGG